MKKFFTVLGAAVLLLTTGCLFNSREVTVSPNTDLSSQREYFRNELFSHDGLALESENFLRGNLLQNDLSSNPRQVLAKLNEFYHISGNPKYLIIAADLCRYLASRENTTEAVKYHLATLYYCTTFMREIPKIEAGRETAGIALENYIYSQGSRNYNEACCGIFNFLKERGLLRSDAVTLYDAEGRTYFLQKPEYRLSVKADDVEEFSLCAAYDVSNLRQINRRPGLGVPLAARIRNKQWYDSLKTPHGMVVPMTLAVKREDLKSGALGLRLFFIDTGVREELQQDIRGVKNNRWQLALDFSTPLACYLDGMKSRNLLAQMLNPFEQEDTDGLYMVEPYQPDKIPVVFIHGLMSSPETWTQMINSLKNDPTIRQRYQFWFFSYSTGEPVMLSACKLHEALTKAYRELSAKHPEAEANLNKMVLVGHSMGGMLTRQMLQKKQYYMAETLLGLKWDEIKKRLDPETFREVEKATLPALPFVHRAVFMASPHRGANLAQTFIGRLGAYLIKLPKSLLEREVIIRRVISRLNLKLLPNLHNRFYTGIDNLDPDNPFVLAHGVSPMKDDLFYHCIIGNQKENGIPGGSDGVVPYWSSHLDGAASELVVQSNHSVHRQPGAIQEVLRILLLHLKEADKK